MQNDMAKLLIDNPNQPLVAYLAAALAWNNGWTEHNQQLIDTLAPLGFLIEGGPTVDIATDSHPSLDPALRNAAADTDGYASLVAWVKESEQLSGHKNPATYVPLMMKTENGRTQLSDLLSQPSGTN